jgi:hypothetical protein
MILDPQTPLLLSHFTTTCTIVRDDTGDGDTTIATPVCTTAFPAAAATLQAAGLLIDADALTIFTKHPSAMALPQNGDMLIDDAAVRYVIRRVDNWQTASNDRFCSITMERHYAGN